MQFLVTCRITERTLNNVLEHGKQLQILRQSNSRLFSRTNRHFRPAHGREQLHSLEELTLL
jgi:hypothetical protein